MHVCTAMGILPSWIVTHGSQNSVHCVLLPWLDITQWQLLWEICHLGLSHIGLKIVYHCVLLAWLDTTQWQLLWKCAILDCHTWDSKQCTLCIAALTWYYSVTVAMGILPSWIVTRGTQNSVPLCIAALTWYYLVTVAMGNLPSWIVTHGWDSK